MSFLTYCRIIRCGVSKYGKLCRQYNYNNAATYQLQSRNTSMAFIPKEPFPKINVSTHSHKHYKQRNLRLFMISSGLFFGLFDFWKPKDEEETPELIMTLKRSILLIQRGEYKKAEQMLHVALNQAQLLQSYEGITYAYDLMANLAFDTKEYKKAEDLFVSVLQRLISTGTPQNDLKVIHISLKMAKLFEETNAIEKAEQGFQFCLNELQSHLSKDSENEDALALLGMTLDWYAHMLFSQSKYAEAQKHLQEAYDICTKLNGEVHAQSVILLNDLGTLCYMMGQYEIALEHLLHAAKLGKRLDDMIEYGSIYVNLGNVFLKKGMIEEATKACERGRNIGKSREDGTTVSEAKKCLHEIEKYLTVQKEKQKETGLNI